MLWFHNVSTLAKLLGTFAALCAVMGIVGYLGVSTAQAIKADVDNATGNLLPGALAAAAIDGSLNDIRVNVRSAALTSDAKQTAEFVQSATAAFTEAEKQEAVFKSFPLDPLDARILADFDKAYPQWKALMQDAAKSAALNTDASNAAAADIVLNKVTTIGAQVDKDLNDLIDSQTLQALDAEHEAAATYESATRVLIATIIGAIVAAMAIGFYVARSLANPLKLMAAAANGIAEGDLEQEITLDRKDEVGQAAAGFRRAIAYLKGMAEVADAMAEGDLTRTVEPQSARDGLGTSFKKMILNLRDLVGQVQASAISLADTSAQLGSAASQTGAAVQQVTMAVQNVATGAQETSRSAQETTAAVSQLSQVIDGIAGAPPTRRARSRPPARPPPRWRLVSNRWLPTLPR